MNYYNIATASRNITIPLHAFNVHQVSKQCYCYWPEEYVIFICGFIEYLLSLQEATILVVMNNEWKYLVSANKGQYEEYYRKIIERNFKIINSTLYIKRGIRDIPLTFFPIYGLISNLIDIIDKHIAAHRNGYQASYAAIDEEVWESFKFFSEDKNSDGPGTEISVEIETSLDDYLQTEPASIRIIYTNAERESWFVPVKFLKN